MTAAFLQNSPDLTIVTIQKSGDVRVTVETDAARDTLQLGTIVAVGGSVTLVATDARRFLGKAESSGLIVADLTIDRVVKSKRTDQIVKPGTFHVVCPNGNLTLTGNTDTMFRILRDGTIVAGHFDDTIRTCETIHRTWIIPGIHTEITVRLPAQPGESAKAAICHLMDHLFQA